MLQYILQSLEKLSTKNSEKNDDSIIDAYSV